MMAASLLGAPLADRFDESVRQDYQAGFAGDKAALARAMKVSEDVLASNPKHGEAMAWHGAGRAYLAGQAFQAGDDTKGMELWEGGLQEMDDAVAAEPENIHVLRVRGATLLAATKSPMMPPEMAAPLLAKGLGDYEKILSLEKDEFAKRDAAYRGQLLADIANGWDRAGKPDQARSYYERIVKELPDTDYAQQARKWLAGNPPK
jgi:tetratricopeptide (TPR) repeat protein